MSSKGVKFAEEDPSVFEYEQTEVPEQTKKKEQSQKRKDWFLNYMSVSLGITTPPKLLDEVCFEGVARYIAEGKCSKIVTMAGAGISTSAGIPDYRSPGTGLFDLLKDKYPNVEHVTDLFNIQFFMRDPKPFFERSRLFYQISLKPTPAHYFVRLLHEKGLLLRHYTQNIDTLERQAGLPEDKVVEAHGSYYTSHCMDCDKEYSFVWMEERVMLEDVPRCEEEGCTGVIKPDIVMFGESLPSRFGECSEEDTLDCDLLIIMGTALAVQPFACLTSKVKTCTPRLYINLDRGRTGKRHPMSDIMFGGGFDFDGEENIRDVHKQEKCDEACYQLADIAGWGEELRRLVETEHARIDAEDLAKGKTKPSPTSDDRLTGQKGPPTPAATAADAGAAAVVSIPSASATTTTSGSGSEPCKTAGAGGKKNQAPSGRSGLANGGGKSGTSEVANGGGKSRTSGVANGGGKSGVTNGGGKSGTSRVANGGGRSGTSGVANGGGKSGLTNGGGRSGTSGVANGGDKSGVANGGGKSGTSGVANGGGRSGTSGTASAKGGHLKPTGAASSVGSASSPRTPGTRGTGAKNSAAPPTKGRQPVTSAKR